MVWDQELGLVQDRQLLLTLVALDDHLGVGQGCVSQAGSGATGMGGGGGTHRDLAGVLVADLLHLLTAVGCGQEAGSKAERSRSPFALPVAGPAPRAPAPRAVRPQGLALAGLGGEAPAQA